MDMVERGSCLLDPLYSILAIAISITLYSDKEGHLLSMDHFSVDGTLIETHYLKIVQMTFLFFQNIVFYIYR